MPTIILNMTEQRRHFNTISLPLSVKVLVGTVNKKKAGLVGAISEYCEYIGANIGELYWDRITQDICCSRDNGQAG